MHLKIFLTGASGYVGGTVLARLYAKYPECKYHLLVRNDEQAEEIKVAFPNAVIVRGTLEDWQVVSDAAKQADIVIDTADSADSVPGAKAIANGLAAGHSNDSPGYWIHLSGTAILMWNDTLNNRNGEAPIADERYDDGDGVGRLFNLPSHAAHRNVDLMVQNAMSSSVRVAIVCPPTIYDTGAGPINSRSKQVPDLVRCTLNSGFAPVVGKGLTEWDHINVNDLAELYVKLVEAANDPDKNSNPDIFGHRAYYLAESGSHRWSDVSSWIAEECSRQGYLTEASSKSMTLEEASKLQPAIRTSFAHNSKGIATRAKQFLGWQPVGRPLQDTIPELVAREAALLGTEQKHKQ